VTYFFNVAMAQLDYEMAKRQVESSDTMYNIGLQRHKIAAISKADLLTLELDRVNARNSLENSRISLKRATFALASFLNLEKDIKIEVELPERPGELVIPMAKALEMAMANNPSLLGQQQAVLEAEREVNRTKAESHLNASVNMSVGFNQVADKLKNAYRHPLQQDIISVNLNIPIVDWGIRKGRHNMAKNDLNVAEISARQEEVSLEEEVFITVEDFNIQKDLIGSAEEALKLADMAYTQTMQRFMIGKADVNSMTMALSRQQEAQRNWLQTLQNYWLNYYKIRRLTLYDFEAELSLSEMFDYSSIIY
ncbi:MAG: TolC family protein, partial [Bacteroidales bacterium]|nr:TolC family protein [Bacteroidales bacterium]